MKTLILAALAVACTLTAARADDVQNQTCGKILTNLGVLRDQQRQLMGSWLNNWSTPSDNANNTAELQRKSLNFSQLIQVLGQDIAMYRDMFQVNGCNDNPETRKNANDILMAPMVFNN